MENGERNLIDRLLNNASEDDGGDSLFSAFCPLARLRSTAEQYRAAYEKAEPYPHLMVDGLYDPMVLDRVFAEFPKRRGRDWLVWDTEHELKTTSRGISELPTFTQLFFLIHQMPDFIRILEQITGIPNLLPDPTFHGAGLQEVFRDGWLDIHSDYTRHPILPLRRRINLLVYLNRGWDAAWGGDIELWDYDTRQCDARYAPLFNRTLIFPTTARTLHGQPSRLNCPADVSRRFISLYYWSALSPEEESAEPIHWYGDQPDAWEKNLDRFVNVLSETIPKESTFILIDNGDLGGNDILQGRNVIPFLEKNGAYNGAPPDDMTAIREFARVRESNPQYLVVAWPAFWWLTHYGEFHRHLRSNFECRLENECMVVFDLRRSPGKQ